MKHGHSYVQLKINRHENSLVGLCQCSWLKIMRVNNDAEYIVKEERRLGEVDDNQLLHFLLRAACLYTSLCMVP